MTERGRQSPIGKRERESVRIREKEGRVRGRGESHPSDGPFAVGKGGGEGARRMCDITHRMFPLGWEKGGGVRGRGVGIERA